MAKCPDETPKHIPQTVLEQVHEGPRARPSTDGGGGEGKGVRHPIQGSVQMPFRHVQGGHIYDTKQNGNCHMFVLARLFKALATGLLLESCTILP